MSQLLERLQRDLGLLTDPARRAEVAAQIAGQLARHGRFDEARQAISNIRQQYGQGQSGRVTVWLMLAEGLVHHYEDLSPSALERVRGAQALGLAMKYSTVVALSSAWKAHIEFERSDFESMFASLALADQHVTESEHDAQSRLAIVLANCFMLTGDRGQGHYWFKRGHFHAVANGDQASVDALLYNRAAFSLAWLRVMNCRSAVAQADLASVRTDVMSAKSLQHLMRVHALGSHVRLLEARLLILESKHESAILALLAVRNAVPFASHNFNQSFVDLEIFFCRVRQGDIATAIAEFPGLDSAQFDALDIDERIVAAWMLCQMASVDARFGDAVTFQDQLEVLWAKYNSEQSGLSQGLVSFVRA